jgi:hypothetical protein
MSEPIQIWPFDEAPAELRELSNHGGDEDWLALVPPHLAERDIWWMEAGTSFGWYDVSEHQHPTLDGWVVRIGAHA